MNNRLKRLLAILAVIILIGMVIITLIFGITGNKNFIGMLILTLMTPIIIYAYMILYKFFSNKN